MPTAINPGTHSAPTVPAKLVKPQGAIESYVPDSPIKQPDISFSSILSEKVISNSRGVAASGSQNQLSTAPELSQRAATNSDQQPPPIKFPSRDEKIPSDTLGKMGKWTIKIWGYTPLGALVHYSSEKGLDKHLCKKIPIKDNLALNTNAFFCPHYSNFSRPIKPVGFVVNNGKIDRTKKLSAPEIKDFIKNPQISLPPYLGSLGSKAKSERTPRSIIGTDNRIQVNPKDYPYRSIGLLSSTMGSVTAWLISPDTIVTAAHGVFEKGFGENFKFHIMLGTDGYKSSTIREIWLPQDYINSHIQDIAILKLTEPLGTKTGWFGYRSDRSIEAYDHASVSMAGYPNDKNGFTLWLDKGKVRAEDNILSTNIDTVEGTSGAPYYLENLHAFGLNTLSRLNSVNIATRITPPIFVFMTYVKNRVLTPLNVPVPTQKPPNNSQINHNGSHTPPIKKKWSDGIEIGKFYEGKVVSLKPYGVFVKLSPDRYGLVHNSELGTLPIHVGDLIKVKCIGIDEERQRISLSRI